MKKIIFLFATIALLLSSCEGPRGPMGPQGPQGEMNWEIIDLTVNPSSWEPFYDSNKLFLHYRCILDLPELDEFIYDKGTYITYIRHSEGNNEVQELLPAISNHENEFGDLWTRTINCDYMYKRTGGTIKSSIAIYVKDNDFYEGSENRPGKMKFRVVLMW